MQTTHLNIFEKDNKSNEKEGESKDGIPGSFECNICLDTVQDPVVTFCGHLYCWHCIYRWIQRQETSPENQNTWCPVCKEEITEKTMVPLYGPNLVASNYGIEEKVPRGGLLIPPRPTTPRNRQRLGTSVRDGYQRLAPTPLAVLPAGGRSDHMNIDSVVVHSPIIGMVGEMICGKILGDLDSPLFGTPPNSYNNNLAAGGMGARRRTSQADRSLSRIFCLLFCCTIFCLVMFT
uniref:E3 ubiquitin-protein ligase RMA1H1-like n=1 Tax=Erigeron canadensis TaxID=72917 RepID=UPI001CB95177|nr:E3 ubiquitin-protein ligase RMA1H1-like [Erigeron canadensis]